MKALVLSAVLAACFAVTVGASTPAMLATSKVVDGPERQTPMVLAQTSRDDQRIRRLLDPQAPQPPQVTPPSDPLSRFERDEQRFLQDPAARLGLPPNPMLTEPSAPDAAADPPVLPPELGRFGRDSDGAITREDYLRARSRPVPAGPAGEARRQQMLQRLDSRFRAADRDRDGRVTPQELREYGNPRF